MNASGRGDPFEVLGVDEAASPDEVKGAYRKLAMKAHPDRGGDGEEFRRLHEAFQALDDPASRREAEDKRRRARGRPEAFSAFDGLFDDLTARSADVGTRRRRGVDVERRLEVGVAAAMRGGRHVLKHAAGQCSICAGRGTIKSAVPRTCPNCEGGGVLRRTKGFVRAEEPCPTCEGVGRANVVDCAFCGGQGVVQGSGVEVDLPPGVRSGTKLTVRGAGAPGAGGGPRGDLVVEVAVTVPDGFVGCGDDVEATVSIPVWDAALGTTLSVPNVEGGTVSVMVAPGTQPGTRLSVFGAGMPDETGGRGKMTVVVEVEVPDGSREPLRALFTDMRAAANPRIRSS